MGGFFDGFGLDHHGGHDGVEAGIGAMMAFGGLLNQDSAAYGMVIALAGAHKFIAGHGELVLRGIDVLIGTPFECNEIAGHAGELAACHVTAAEAARHGDVVREPEIGVSEFFQHGDVEGFGGVDDAGVHEKSSVNDATGIIGWIWEELSRRCLT